MGRCQCLAVEIGGFLTHPTLTSQKLPIARSKDLSRHLGSLISPCLTMSHPTFIGSSQWFYSWISCRNCSRLRWRTVEANHSELSSWRLTWRSKNTSMKPRLDGCICKWLQKNMFKQRPGIELEWNLVWDSLRWFEMARFESLAFGPFWPWISHQLTPFHRESPTKPSILGDLGHLLSTLGHGSADMLGDLPPWRIHHIYGESSMEWFGHLAIAWGTSNLGGIGFSPFHWMIWLIWMGVDEQWSAHHRMRNTRSFKDVQGTNSCISNSHVLPAYRPIVIGYSPQTCFVLFCFVNILPGQVETKPPEPSDMGRPQGFQLLFSGAKEGHQHRILGGATSKGLEIPMGFNKSCQHV